MGHFVTLGPLTFPNLNISTIWVRDPWVSIQINFLVSLPPTKEVLHTCKIVNYFLIANLLLAGGANCWGKGLWRGAKGWGKKVGEGWLGKGGGVRGARGWDLYFNKVFNKTASTLVY